MLLQQYMNDIILDKDSRYYSEEEESILRQYYPEFGSAYCADLLPGRTKDAISRYAAKLGLTRVNVF